MTTVVCLHSHVLYTVLVHGTYVVSKQKENEPILLSVLCHTGKIARSTYVLMNQIWLNIPMCRLYNDQWHSAHLGITNLLEVEVPKEPPKPEKVSVHSNNLYMIVAMCKNRVVLTVSCGTLD